MFDRALASICVALLACGGVLASVPPAAAGGDPSAISGEKSARGIEAESVPSREPRAPHARPRIVVERRDPEAVPPRRFTRVEAGSSYTCALDGHGQAYCWGIGVPGRGRAGEATTCEVEVDIEEYADVPCSAEPVPVAPGLRFRSLSVDNGACGLTVDGEAHCWHHVPSNVQALQGAGPRPIPVPALRFASLVENGVHTCGLTEQGEAYCWGWWTQHPSAPAERCDGWGNCLTAPERVAPALRFRGLSIGNRHGCGITAESRAYCWGANDDGEVGRAERRMFVEPQPVPHEGELAEIAVGDGRTCALTAGQDLLCWGHGWGHRPVALKRAQGVQLSGHGRQFCTLSPGGVLQCLKWDHSFAGQHSIPLQAYELPGHRRFVHVSVGYMHMCAIALDGDAYCWGVGGDGALGGGAFPGDVQPQPARVVAPR